MEKSKNRRQNDVIEFYWLQFSPKAQSLKPAFSLVEGEMSSGRQWKFTSTI